MAERKAISLQADAACGHCGACKFWQADHDGQPHQEHVGLCVHEELAHFNLEVGEGSGCNHFEAAQVPAGV